MIPIWLCIRHRSPAYQTAFRAAVAWPECRIALRQAVRAFMAAGGEPTRENAQAMADGWDDGCTFSKLYPTYFDK